MGDLCFLATNHHKQQGSGLRKVSPGYGVLTNTPDVTTGYAKGRKTLWFTGFKHAYKANEDIEEEDTKKHVVKISYEDDHVR